MATSEPLYANRFDLQQAVNALEAMDNKAEFTGTMTVGETVYQVEYSYDNCEHYVTGVHRDA